MINHNNVLKSVSFMIKQAWEIRREVLVISLLISLLNVIAEFLRLFSTKVIVASIEEGNAYAFLHTILLCGICIALTACFQRYFSIESKTINTKSSHINVRNHIRNKIIQKAIRTSFPNSRNPQVRTLLAGALDATEGYWCATETVWNRLQNLLYSLLSFCIYICLLSNLNYLLAVISILLTSCGFVIRSILEKRIKQYKKEENAYVNQMNYIKERATCIAMGKDIRVFGMAAWLEDIYNDALILYRDCLDHKEKKCLIADFINILLQVLRNGVVYVFLLKAVFARDLLIPEFVLYFNALSDFSERLVNIFDNISLLRRDCIDISVVEEYLDYPEIFRFEEGESIPKSTNYTIELRNVTFSFPGSKKPLFKNFNLTITSGEKLAVVGLNGAGKTTLVHLLSGLLDPNDGSVLLNGIDIRTYNRNEYYNLFSAVFQDSYILNATIAENIAMTSEDVDNDKLVDCLRKANLLDMINSLPRHTSTHIGKEVFPDGIEFSGGKTQQLLLARALYKNAYFLILDEPTAALDPLAEARVYENYNQIAHGKTAIFISHRLASTRFCDRIVLLENGEIIETGTHDNLLALGKRYYELFCIQRQYYRKG